MTITQIDPPEGISLGTVEWFVFNDVQDGADPGTGPDFIAPVGTVSFVSSVGKLLGPDFTVIRDVIVGVIDEQGYLCTPDLTTMEPVARGVQLIANDDPDLNPQGTVYNVSYQLKSRRTGKTLKYPEPHKIAVLSGQTVNLSNFIPPDNAQAIGIPQANALAAQAAADAAAAQVSAAAAEAALVDSAEFVGDEIATDGTPAAVAVAAKIATGVAGKQDAATLKADVGSKISEAGAARDAVDARAAASVAPVASVARLRAPIPPTAARVRRMLGAFASGHGWTKSGGGSSTFNLDDTNTRLLGTQSITFATDGTANALLFRKTGLAADLTGKALRCYCKIDDLSMLGYVQIWAGDSTLTNAYRKQIIQPASVPSTTVINGEWATVDFLLDTMVVQGTPNRAAIDTLQFLVLDGGSGKVVSGAFGGMAIVDVNELGRWPNGVVAVTFDDSFASHHTIARPYLDKYGYVGSLFPILARLDIATYLTTAQVRELYAQGWEIGAHATTSAIHNAGLTTLTPTQQVAELEALRQWNADNGMMSTSYAYPLGYWNAATAAIASRYYSSARIVHDDGTNNARLEAPFRVRSVNAGTYGSTLTTLAAKAKSEKSAMVVTFHDIKASGATGNDISTANFQAFIDYCAANSIPVVPYGEIVAASVA